MALTQERIDRIRQKVRAANGGSVQPNPTSDLRQRIRTRLQQSRPQAPQQQVVQQIQRPQVKVASPQQFLDAPKPKLRNRLRQIFSRDNFVESGKELAQGADRVKEFFASTRGFDQKEILDAKPNTRDVAVGAAKLGTEFISQGADAFRRGSGFLFDKIGLDKTATSTRERNPFLDKGIEFSQPQTAEEAKVMQAGDVAGLLFGGVTNPVGKAVGKTSQVANASRRIPSRSPSQIDRFLGTPSSTESSLQQRRIPSQGRLQQDRQSQRQGIQSPELQTLRTNENFPTLSNLPKSPLKTEKTESSLSYSDAKEIIDGDKTAVRKLTTELREFLQDKNVRLKKLVNSKRTKVSDQSDPYLAETLFHGRVSSRIDDLKKEVSTIQGDVVKKSKDLKIKDSEFTDAVDTYLVARHAPERNQALGDGAAGMSTKEAQDTINRIDNSADGSKVREVANKLQSINDRTLDVLLDGEIITQELYDTLRSRYKNHVPLQRILDEDDEFSGILTGKGFSVNSTGVKKAKGSDKKVADITTNIVDNLEQAFIRAEKNRVGLSMLRFSRENEGLGGLIEESVKHPGGNNVLTVREKGKQVFLKIKDKRIADSLNGLGEENLGRIMSGVGAITRFMAGINTRFNPEFAFGNVIRDIQENMVYMGSRKDIKSKGGLDIPANIPKSGKDVLDHLRGKDTEGALLYKQMIDDGGTTGGLGLSTRAQTELNIDKIRKLSRSKGKRALKGFVDTIDNWNTIFEDANRLAAYKSALKSGLSRDRAAQVAKESTVNFNRKGRAGAFINSLYMFANASIQGSAKMIIAMKNPKVAAAVGSAIAIPTVTFNDWNDQIDPEWREKVSDFERQKNLVILRPTEDGSTRYIKIPLGYGLVPVKALIDAGDDVRKGHAKETEGISNVLTSIADSYNPIGGGDAIQTITPSLIDPLIDASRNVNFFGSPIGKNDKKGVADKTEFFPSLEKSATGRAAIATTDKLFDITDGIIDWNPADVKYVFEQYTGGLGKSATRAVNYLRSVGGDEDVPIKDIPVINRFIGEKEGEQIEQSEFFNNRDDILGEISKIDPNSPEYRDRLSELMTTGTSTQEEYERLYRSLGFEAQTTGISSNRSVEQFKPEFNRLQTVSEEEALAEIDAMTDEQYEVYKKTRGIYRSANKRQLNDLLETSPQEAVQFVRGLPEHEGNRLIDLMSDEEYEVYEGGKD